MDMHEMPVACLVLLPSHAYAALFYGVAGLPVLSLDGPCSWIFGGQFSLFLLLIFFFFSPVL